MGFGKHPKQTDCRTGKKHRCCCDKSAPVYAGVWVTWGLGERQKPPFSISNVSGHLKTPLLMSVDVRGNTIKDWELALCKVQQLRAFQKT